MYRIHRNCRACNSGDLTPVFNLGIQPLANDFCGTHDECAGYAPLQVLYCENCSLGQLSVVVDPSVMFSKYAYVTSNSATMTNHFEKLHADIVSDCGQLGSVLEIGSNDGSLLSFLKKRGATGVLGVDPAENLASVANANGIPTLAKEFDIPSAEVIKNMITTPDVIIARHVFCHCPNWRSFLAALQIVAAPKTLIVLEVPHAEKMLKNSEFDTIYHEHFSYLTLRSVEALLKGSPLVIDNVRQYPIHGGTIGIFIRREDARRTVSSATDDVTREDWRAFGIRSRVLIEELANTVSARAISGKKICGFGASAKCTVWMNACGFSKREISFVTDTTEMKIGKTVPGTDIPIVAESELLNQKPDYAVMFCWNFREEVLKKRKDFSERGGKWIVPIPKLEII